jgi:hypothetical protein
VVDMAWILPGMLLTAVWLWRKQAIGYALAGALSPSWRSFRWRSWRWR